MRPVAIEPKILAIPDGIQKYLNAITHILAKFILEVGIKMRGCQKGSRSPIRHGKLGSVD